MKEKILKTILIIAMIASITLAHIIILATDVISYAFHDVGRENVEFKVQVEEQKPINSHDLKISMQVTVKKEGYLNGKIQLNNENFKFKQEPVEGVETITDQEITLKQINGGEQLNLSIGLDVNLPEKINLSTFNQENSLLLKGSYTNAIQNKSEVEIEAKAKIELTKPETEEEVSFLDAQILTNKIYQIGGQNKRLIQVEVKSGLQEVSYPIKQSLIQLEAPEGVEKITIAERGTYATNGKEEGKNNDQTFSHHQEGSKLAIQIKNPEEEGKISYQKQKQDTIIVTYLYKEEKQFQEEAIKIKNNILIYDQEQTTYEKEIEAKIEEEKEEIINYTIENEAEIYKGNLYIGQEQNYKSMSKIDIRYPEIENNIKIQEGNSYYQANNNEEEYQLPANSIYKKTMINQEQLLNILGDEGELILKKEDGKLIQKINKQTINPEEKILSIEHETDTKQIILEINHAKNQGTLDIMHEKAIAPEHKERNEVKALESLVVEGTLKATNQIGERKAEGRTKLLETITKAETSINNNQLVAGTTNENVEIKTTLVTNENSCELYKNPEIEVEFPEKIEQVTLKNVSLLYGEGLIKQNEQIYQNENGNMVAKIELLGEQANYVDNELVKGANVILNCDLKVAAIEENEEQQIQVNYTNHKAEELAYENDGKNQIDVNYIVTETTQNAANQKEEENKQETEQAPEQTTAPITVSKTIAAGNGSDIYEGQAQKYIIKIKNNTNQEIKNIHIKDEIPEELVYLKTDYAQGYANVYQEDETKKAFELQIREITEEEEEQMEEDIHDIDPQEITTLKPNKEIEIFYHARVRKNAENVGKTIGTKAQIKIEQDDTIYETNLVENTIKASNIQVDMIANVSPHRNYIKGSCISYKIVIKNIAGQKLTGIKAYTTIPEYTSYVEAASMIYSEEDNSYVEDKTETRKNAIYNQETETVTWEVGNLKEGEEKAFFLSVRLESTEKTTKLIPNQITVQGDNLDPSHSNVEEVKQSGVAECTIVKQTDLPSKYVYEGSQFQYIITVVNTGEQPVMGNLVDELPEGVMLNEVFYKIEGNQEKNIITDELDLSFNLPVGKTMQVRLLVEAELLPDGRKELEIKNKARVTDQISIDKVSNEVVNVILRDPNRPDNGNNGANNSQNCSISGMAWIDRNENGAKDYDEEMLEGVPVKLYDNNGNQTGITATTGQDGKYSLNNVPSGSYLVVFEYDNRNYALTEYQKAGVIEEDNSNVTTGNLGGRTVAITDKIEVVRRNIENINMGVIESDAFDLKLDKYITAITVQNGKTSKKYSYNNANFAKVELDRKTINGATVTIEYKIDVTNEGDILGYAKEIADYLPSDLQFNPGLNKDWTEENGKLVSKKLADQVINPGETKSLNLVVTKQMTEDNLGTVTNTAEITKDYNENLIADIDSTPANKVAEEDDISTVSVIIGLNTGGVIMYITLIITTIIILTAGTYFIKKKVLKA